MKTVRLHPSGILKLHDEVIPTTAPGEYLLRVTAVGLCGSDLLWLSSQGIGDAHLESPLVLGHEFAGVVESGEYKGLRVAVDPAVPCGICRSCRDGHPNLCPNTMFAGHGTVDGALREYISWPAACLHPLPDSLTDAEGAMLEPLGVAIHALDLGRLKTGATVGIFGCGPIGLLLVQLAKIAGAVKIVATDKIPKRLELAARLGATNVFPAQAGAEIEAVFASTDGHGVDTAFEVAGDNDAVETAVNAARPGGCVVLIGIPENDRTGFQASTARRKGLTIMMVRRMKHTYPRAISLAAQGLVDLNAVIGRRYALGEFEKAFETARKREGLKVIIEP
jgi:L-iditol 2-dehydrogenase